MHDQQPCCGYLDLYSKWHDNSEVSFLRDASLENSLTWRVNFKTEVCSKATNPSSALQWIKESETAKSLDDFLTPKPFTDKNFPDMEELDLMMAAALKKCYDKQTHFRKKIRVEEQKAQKNDRFIRGDKIAYFMYDYFRTTGSYDEIQGLSGLFNIRLENDDIQDFDQRWDQALLSASDLPSNKIVESLYISKLQNSSQIQSIMALYNQEIIRGGGQRDKNRVTMCKRSYIEQAQRSKNFRIQNEITERGAVTEGKEQNSFTKRKTR